MLTPAQLLLAGVDLLAGGQPGLRGLQRAAPRPLPRHQRPGAAAGPGVSSYGQ